MPAASAPAQAGTEAYVICTAPRSGSTLLCRLLAATGVAGRPESYFHRPDVDDWLAGLDLSAPEGMSERDRVALAISGAMRAGRAGTEIFGLRLQQHSFPYFADRLAQLHPGATTDRARIEAAFGRTAFVHLRREDKVAQAVSYVKARQTGLWHAAPDGTEIERLAPPRAPAYDADAIGQALAELSAQDRAWQAWFEAERVAPLRLLYEDLAAAPIATLRHVLAHLGCDPQAADGVAPETARLADGVSGDWVTQFRDGSGRA